MQLFRRKREENLPSTDQDAWSAAHSDTTVRTLKAVTSYRRVAAGEIESMKKRIEERKMDSQRWQEYLKLCQIWEGIDANDTQALQAYYSELAKFLTQKKAAITVKQIALDSLRVPEAKAQLQLEQARQQTDEAIAKLRTNQKQLAQSRGWGGNGK